MAEPHVINVLREKQSELGGIVSHLQQQIVHHRASLVHLDAAMRLFDPDLAPEAISSRSPRPRRAGPKDCSWVTQPCEGHDPARRDRWHGLVAGRLGSLRALPGAAEVDRRVASQRQADDATSLLAVADPAQVLWTCRLLRGADEIGAGDVLVMPKLAAAQAGEVGLRAIGAGAVDAVAVLMVDPLHGELGVERIPSPPRAACTMVPLAIRWRMAGTAASSPANTCANVRPRRSRITTTRRLPDWFSDRRRSIRSAAWFSGRTWPPKYAPQVSATRPSPPICSPFTLDAMASRSLCASTKAVLCCTSSSREKASMLRPLTSLQKAATASR